MGITPTPTISSVIQSSASIDIKEAQIPPVKELTNQQFQKIVQTLSSLEKNHQFSCSTYIADETGLSDQEKELINDEHPVLFGPVTSLEKHLASEEREELLNRIAQKWGVRFNDEKEPRKFDVKAISPLQI